MNLNLTQLDNDIRLVALSGRLDLAGVNQIEAEFARACEGERVRLLVDVAQVTFIASTGIRLLLNAAKTVASHDGRVAFVNLNASMRDVLDVIGIFTVIPAYPDLESARRAFAKA